ncbi:MAG: ATP-binding cassette domain-containing protein [Saprospiraceae bacterium]|nr:ATP-binding cassette domain-containing protein [Saprospiraceae bacterium]MBL0295154.1 ATP-binding cassette domain-containing protein [Saprospiraceae bacterium]
MNILSVQNVVKQYANHTAVDHISFDIPSGTIFGLLGPNGAGKTSLIRIITCITKADVGQILFNGTPLNINTPSEIGYMPEERGLYKKMKVGEHLIYLARLKGLSVTEAKAKVGNWLEKFDITSWWNKKIEELSKGMSQKIQFIATVVHEPKLVILDEPFSGLDPINSLLIQDEIIKMQQNGTSIIFSTHRMEQVEEMCHNIVLINKGKNILSGEVNKIRQDFKQNAFRVDFAKEIPESILQENGVIKKNNNSIQITQNDLVTMNRWLAEKIQNGNPITGFKEILPTIGEIFIKQVEENNIITE